MQAYSQGLQVGAVYPFGICRISKTNMLISLLKTFDILLHPHAISVEIPRLETHFQIYIYAGSFCNVVRVHYAIKVFILWS